MPGEMLAKPKMPIWQKLLVGFAVLAGISMVVALSQPVWQLRNADKAFDNFADALVAKNYVEAYQYTAQELRAVTDYDAFVKIHQGLTDRMGDLKKVGMNQFEVKERHDGWYGTLDADLVFANGDLNFSFTLKKENGAWKIYSYHEL